MQTKIRPFYFIQAMRLLDPRQRLAFTGIWLLKTIVGISDLALAGLLYALFLVLQQGHVLHSRSPLDRLLPSSFEGLALCCLAVMVFRLVGDIVSGRWLTGFSQSLYTRFLLSIVDHYAAMPWANYVQRHRSELLKHCLTTSLDAAYTYQLLVELLSSGAVIVCLVGALAWTAPVPAFVIALIIGCLLVAQGQLVRMFLERAAASRESHYRRLQIVVAETLQVQKEIRIYQASAFFRSRIQKHVEEVCAGNATLGNLPQMSRAFVENGAMMAFVVMFLILHKSSNVAHLISMLIFFSVVARRMLPNIAQVLMITGQLGGALHNTRILESELCHGRELARPSMHAAPASTPVLTLENVSFAYRQDHPVLRNINLDIQPGEVVVLQSPSGSGKSSLLNLVCGLIHPTSGAIGIGYNCKIACVPQEVVILDGSIRENVVFGSLVQDDQRVLAALRTAQLADFVLSLPEGLDTRTGDNGVFLSGGQRQRLAIARALLQRPSLLLLDEATAGLDAGNELKLFKSLRQTVPELAILFVTHRAYNLIGADRVIHLQDGGLIEEVIGLGAVS
jgi:ABC-type bacteriocin/lantibiotic exporter with double-glycine peptidase domain